MISPLPNKPGEDILLEKGLVMVMVTRRGHVKTPLLKTLLRWSPDLLIGHYPSGLSVAISSQAACSATAAFAGDGKLAPQLLTAM